MSLKISNSVILNRKLLDWGWYQDSKMVHLFIHLLLKANWKDSKHRGIVVKRGQVFTGRKKLSSETGLSEQSIRTLLKQLKSTSEITIKSTNRYSIITICKYDEYQLAPNDNQPAKATPNQPASQPTNNQQLTTSNISNISKDSNGYTIYRSGESITAEQLQAIIENPKLGGGNREWVEDELEKMVDHYAKSDKRWKNWNAAFRNWIRKAREYNPKFEQDLIKSMRNYEGI